MNKLIKNELFKISKKKVIYILFIIIALVIVVNTAIGTSIYEGTIVDHTQESRKQKQVELMEQLKQIESEKNVDDYVEIKTELDMENLVMSYPYGSWQERVITKYENALKEILRQINMYTYKIEDKEELAKMQSKYNTFLQPLKEDNWKSFVSKEITIIEQNIKELEKEIIKTDDEEQKNIIKAQMQQYKFDLEILTLRLSENISYATSDRNTLLKEYEDNKQTLNAYPKDYGKYNYNEKLQYNKTLESVKELEYKIHNNIPTLEADNARDMLNSSFEFYEVLIILVIIIIAGSIVSEEFNKGTIKLLLVKPFMRWKILLSKFLASVIILIILILFIIILQTLVGGFIYGFDTYKVPIIQYNFDMQRVQSINVFISVFILVLAKLSMYLLVLSITFAISTISCNTSISIILGMLVYLSKNIIYLNDNLEFTKYLLTTNWDFTRYLFGKLPEVSFLKFDFSIMICLISFIVIMFITFIYFKNKDIKNI